MSKKQSSTPQHGTKKAGARKGAGRKPGLATLSITQTPARKRTMMTTNNTEVATAVNEALAALQSPFYCCVGKRALKWFQKYEHNQGAYSTSIGVVERSVACAGDGYNPNRLKAIIAKAAVLQFV